MNRTALYLLAGVAGLAAGFGAWKHFATPPADEVEAPAASPRLVIVDEEPAHRRVPAFVPPIQEPKPAPTGLVDKSWADKNRQAIKLLDGGDPEAAAKLFEECLKGNPGETVFAENLAEALARAATLRIESGSKEGREAGIEALRRAKELAPARADLGRRLELAERLGKSEEGLWTEVSEHFELSYDGERQELLWSSWQVTGELESAYQDFGERFGRWPVEGGRPRIRVVLYRRAGFHEATGIGHWAGGLYDGTVRVPVEELGREKSELTRVLRHEIVHAFVSESGGRSVPGWLNEGLAQWLERRDLDQQQRAVASARAQLRGKTLIPLETLKKSLSTLKDEEQIHLAYLESLAFVDHLERNYGERVLYELVAGCKQGATCETTFEKHARVELARALADLASELE